jgi:hypothetical protein
MGFITRYRGRLREYADEFDESMLLREVTLEEYVEIQYPPHLLEKFPQQARAARSLERAELLAATCPGDRFWLWQRTDGSGRTDGSQREWGGLAVKRGGKLVRVWLAWIED